MALSPAGSFVLVDGTEVVGYALSHPWRLSEIPPLDTLIGALPPATDCLFVHDIALAPRIRGRGLGAEVMGRLEKLARARGLHAMAIVSVYGTHPLWQRLGFEIRRGADIERQLGSYGLDARYMVKGLA
jgi:GNAT superfamily N-acetyltransferase